MYLLNYFSASTRPLTKLCRMKGSGPYNFSEDIEMILYWYDLATLRSLIPSDTREPEHLPDPGTPSLAQGEAVFFPVFCQINSHAALSGAEFVVLPWASTGSLASPRQVASFNASAPPEPNTQARQTLKTHHTRRDTCLQLNYWDDKDNSSQ